MSGRCPHMSRQLGAAGPSRGQAQGQRCWAGRLSAPRHKDMHLTYTVHNMHASHTCLLHIDTPPRTLTRHTNTPHAQTQTHNPAHTDAYKCTRARVHAYLPTTHLAAAQYTVHMHTCTQTQHTHRTGAGCKARASWPLPTTPSPFTGPEAESPSSGSSVSHPLLCSLLPTQQPLPRKFHPPLPGLALLRAAPPPCCLLVDGPADRDKAREGRGLETGRTVLLFPEEALGVPQGKWALDIPEVSSQIR